MPAPTLPPEQPHPPPKPIPADEKDDTGPIPQDDWETGKQHRDREGRSPRSQL